MATRKSNIGGALSNAAVSVGAGFAANKLTSIIPFGSPQVKSAVVALAGIYLSSSKKVKNPMMKTAGSAMTTVAGLNLLSSFGINGTPDVILGDLEISDMDLGGTSFSRAGEEMGF